MSERVVQGYLRPPPPEEPASNFLFQLAPTSTRLQLSLQQDQSKPARQSHAQGSLTVYDVANFLTAFLVGQA